MEARLTSSLPPAPCLTRLVAVSVTTRPSRSAAASSIDRRRASATRFAPRLRNLAAFLDDDLHCHRQRMIVTRVPLPGVDSSANSLTSRRAPPSPSPRPDPDVKPSFSASWMSSMPGPWSTNVSRSPLRGPAASWAISTSPPPP